MNLETSVYFLIILNGFSLVWGFRKGIDSRSEISDFEYAAFSAFWGVPLFSIFQWLFKNDQEKFVEVIKTPLVAGTVFSLFSGLAGYVIGAFLWKIRSAMEGR